MDTGYKVNKAENRRPRLLEKDGICHHWKQGMVLETAH